MKHWKVKMQVPYLVGTVTAYGYVSAETPKEAFAKAFNMWPHANIESVAMRASNAR